MTGGGSSSSDVHKLEKLMAKIGLFSVVYVLSTSALLASLFYQLLHVDMWLRVARDPCPLLSSYQFDYQKVTYFVISYFIRLACNSFNAKDTLKPQSNGPLYSNTVIGTLAIDGWAVTFWYSEEGRGRAAAPPSPLLAVPNVTAHPSTASVPTSYYSMWHYNCL